MGFDYSSECFIKGDKNIIILNDIGGFGEIQGQPENTKKPDDNFWLLTMFNMEPIKAELFDCDQYIMTIDDLIV